jgi:TRAP-type C4-dicarboxylate transport system substrate-binding protein
MAIAVLATLLAGVASAASEPIKLKLHHLLGPKSNAHRDMLVPWVERVEKAAAGKVKIEIYPAMSLGGKPPQLIRQVRDGVVDIIWTVNGYTPGLFPRTEVFELPLVHTNNITATNLAMYDMFEEYLAGDYRGVRPLFLHVHAGNAIHMVDTLVRKPEDLAGKRMRIPTRTGAWVLEALGTTPVGMPVPDLPQALAKKGLDGALIPFEIIGALKLHELTRYQIEGHDGFRLGTLTFQVSMNLARWKSLPKDVQAAFTKESGREWRRELGPIWVKAEVDGLAPVLAAGRKPVRLTEAETQAFKNKVAPVVDRWIKEVKAKGIDGAKLVEQARALIAKHSK